MRVEIDRDEGNDFSSEHVSGKPAEAILIARSCYQLLEWPAVLIRRSMTIQVTRIFTGFLSLNGRRRQVGGMPRRAFCRCPEEAIGDSSCAASD